jgi:uncharacterized protein YjbJ (UPF0337 family)
MNKTQVNGRIKRAHGYATEVIGRALGNKPMERKGKAQRAAGKVIAGYGDIKDDVRDGS